MVSLGFGMLRKDGVEWNTLGGGREDKVGR